MEKQLPKNVRQIGNVSDNPKIYVEDYVDTFLNQLCEKTQDAPLGAFLVGEIICAGEQDSVYIHGALQMKEVVMKDAQIALEEDTIKAGFEECKEYFGGAQILGWFLTMPGMPLALNKNLIRLHEKNFTEDYSVLIMKEPFDKEEIYFTYKFKDLMQLGGHYVYYEKNPSMQNYMIDTRKKNGVTPSEVVEDRAAKNFRNIVREKMEQTTPKQSGRFVYALSTFLILVVVVIGITTLNNYDKMQTVQSSIDHIARTIKGTNSEEPETKETSGQVVASKGEVPDAAKDEAVTGENQEAGTKTKEPTAPGKGDEGIYVVEKGDTLAIISKKAYGDISHVDAICKMNGLTDGNLIFIGQKILLP